MKKWAFSFFFRKRSLLKKHRTKSGTVPQKTGSYGTTRTTIMGRTTMPMSGNNELRSVNETV